MNIVRNTVSNIISNFTPENKSVRTVSNIISNFTPENKSVRYVFNPKSVRGNGIPFYTSLLNTDGSHLLNTDGSLLINI